MPASSFEPPQTASERSGDIPAERPPARGVAVALAIVNGIALFVLFALIVGFVGGGGMARVWHRFQEGGFGMFVLLLVMLLAPVVLIGIGIWNALSEKGWVAPVVLYALLPIGLGLGFERWGMNRAWAAVSSTSITAEHSVRIYAMAVSEAGNVWGFGLLVGGVLFTGAVGVAVVASVGRARRVKLGAPAIAALVGTLVALVVTGVLFAVAGRAQPLAVALVSVPLCGAWVATCVVALVAAAAETPRERGAGLGDVLLVGVLAAGAFLAFTALWHVNGQLQLFAAIGGEAIDPSEVMYFANKGLFELEWAQRRLPFFLVPLLIVTAAAATPLLGSIAGGVKRSVASAALVVLGLGGTFAGRGLGSATDTARLASFAQTRLPPDVTPTPFELMRAKPVEGPLDTVFIVGREKIQRATGLGARPEPIASLSALDGPNCGDVIAQQRAGIERGVAVVIDDSLTVRHMTCVLVGLQYQESGDGRGAAPLLPFGIVAGPRDPRAPVSISWVTRRISGDLPRLIGTLIEPFDFVKVRLQKRESIASVTIAPDRWHLRVRYAPSDLTGSLRDRVAQLSIGGRTGTPTHVVVSAPPQHTGARGARHRQSARGDRGGSRAAGARGGRQRGLRAPVSGASQADPVASMAPPTGAAAGDPSSASWPVRRWQRRRLRPSDTTNRLACVPEEQAEKPLVTVSGASGFIALHCVRELLEQGYPVRATVRSREREQQVREWLAPHVPADSELSFAVADLNRDEGWSEAVEGATYLLHVASPVPKSWPRNENDVIRPAREGTLRALRAASEAGVRRVVLTSSTAAVISGHERGPDRVFDENDWSNLDGAMGAYEKSKTLAERAAWEFVDGLPTDRKLELVTTNPSFVLGPSLSGRENASNEVTGRLLRREMPGVPRLHVGLVDVRDVATAHVSAMVTPEAAGQRFLLMAEALWMVEIARILKEAGYRVTTLELPNAVVRVVALFDRTVRLITPRLGKPFQVNTERARTVLGWKTRPPRDTVLDTARASIGAPP